MTYDNTGNTPIDWMPKPYERLSPTDCASGQQVDDEAPSWAELAARARAQWGRDNAY